MFKSSTRDIPETRAAPRHVAIIMDGNGRWAKKRFLPRVGGHRRGVETVREVIKSCMERGVQYLTLFAFSSENWRRPAGEVSTLLGLLVEALDSEVEQLHARRVRLRFIGERGAFAAPLRERMAAAERLTKDNEGLTLVIALDYGGRWDVLQAARAVAAGAGKGGDDVHAISETGFARHLALGDLPDPDLFIRTGGEHRISNFLIWNLAYTELFFTDTLWPDFGAAELDAALRWYAGRDRRFGTVAGDA